MRLFPLPLFCGNPGSCVLDAIHEAQKLHPLREIWDPSRKLPRHLLEYVCGVAGDFPPHVRQQAVLMLKRHVLRRTDAKTGRLDPRAAASLQVAALSCVNLASKLWQHEGVTEQKLHWLSRNSFTRKDFMAAEVDVLASLNGILHWEGALIAEWVALLLHLAGPLLAGEEARALLSGVASHVADVLAFQDQVMCEYPPAELAAASIHASVLLCTKYFQRYTLTLRVGHLARTSEERIARLSEQILTLCIGSKYAEHILEGSGLIAEDSDLEPEAATTGRRRGRGGLTTTVGSAAPRPPSPELAAAKRLRRGGRG